jgi:Tfp pilus assembly ATPase PilU
LSARRRRAVFVKEDFHQIYGDAGRNQHGMQTMNQALFQAYVRKLISLDGARPQFRPGELEQMLEKVGVRVAV